MQTEFEKISIFSKKYEKIGKCQLAKIYFLSSISPHILNFESKNAYHYSWGTILYRLEQTSKIRKKFIFLLIVYLNLAFSHSFSIFDTFISRNL